MATVSFSEDIAPLFKQFRGQMIWRFDLADYDDMRANADLVYEMISSSQMPPPPFDPFSSDQTKMFKAWMAGGYLH